MHPQLSIWILVLGMVFSDLLVVTPAVEYTPDGLEIRMNTTCRQIDIECPYNHSIEILSKLDGAKTYHCPNTEPECCSFNETTDCYQPTTPGLLRFQRQVCENRTTCTIYLPGGISVGCAISQYVVVSYVCQYGGPTTLPSTTLPPTRPAVQKTEVNLLAALIAPIVVVFALVVIILLVIYYRYYRGHKDLLEADKTPSSVTHLRMKVDKSQARVKTAPRFKLDTGLSGHGLGLHGSKWSKSNIDYRKFGNSELHSQYSYAPTGNIWKQANWMTSLSSPNHIYKKRRDDDKVSRARFLMAARDRDLDSLGFEDDLGFPDISIFSIAQARQSPDSGLDNLGYILPVIQDPPAAESPALHRHSPAPHRSSPAPVRNSPAPALRMAAYHRNSPASARHLAANHRSSPAPVRNSPAPALRMAAYHRNSPASARHLAANHRTSPVPVRHSPTQPLYSPALSSNPATPRPSPVPHHHHSPQGALDVERLFQQQRDAVFQTSLSPDDALRRPQFRQPTDQRRRYDSGIIPDHDPVSNWTIPTSPNSAFQPHQSNDHSDETNDAFSNLSSTIGTEMLY
ncbi:uncharacterized protein LOC135461693 [Liolophura sinensis]|uniref:uncharacterized protein LOC135461693 n=1 Tax=Liolophura sinensis TaxID=3198878 RepID=UPI0031588B01